MTNKTETAPGAKPTHEVFHVVGDGDKARWTKIGVGWTHHDGSGLNLIISYSPLIAGRTVVRKVKPKQETA
ncbi:MAG: hypothetical protein ACE360_04150 [Hyphomicrobiales bacterium]